MDVHKEGISLRTGTFEVRETFEPGWARFTRLDRHVDLIGLIHLWKMRWLRHQRRRRLVQM